MVEISSSELTLEEKAALTSGADFWTTKSIERVGLPSIMVSDGPHGLRKQAGASDHLGLSGSVPATCFPPAVALASSWDPELVARVGAAIAVEAAIEDVAVVLGPGVNIKRSPLCGRNFEYYSEDPLLAGVLGAAWVRGAQSHGVGTSLKHFAANNQETDRMRCSSDVDMRPLRELYLRAFERVVKQAHPWTVMCSYNKINGVYASENRWLLTQVLRDEWGFDGLVVSDWGAVNDRVKGLAAGMDLEMPGSGGRTDTQLVDAVRAGRLDEAALDKAAQRVINLVAKAQERPHVAGPLDVDAHHRLARSVAAHSIVLLKNDGALLPLARSARVAVIGEFAKKPRYQGAGSSLINPTRLNNALDEIRALSRGEVLYAPGYSLDGSGDSEELLTGAAAAATRADVAIVFLGLPPEDESEGYDRTSIDLPAGQLAVLEAVRAANQNTVVVLSNGGVVALPFRDDVAAIVEGWLLGQAGGGAIADVLYGVVNPSGKLAETIPLRLKDNPTYGNFPGELGHVRYGEGVLVGYRWYDARGLEVAYPFGHGLSYTAFEYSDISAELSGDEICVHVTVSNTGKRAGREVVQAYVGLAKSRVTRAPRELKAFAGVVLQPGETRRVELTIPRCDLAYWDVRADRWVVEGGAYRIDVGASSRDIRGGAWVDVKGDAVVLPLNHNSSVGDVLDHPIAGPLVREQVSQFLAGSHMDSAGASMMANEEAARKMIGDFPIGRIVSFPGMPVTIERVDELIAYANAQLDSAQQVTQATQ
ncbi:MAG: glycoside hydrolase family 3 C-terminal domain-containing protein [Ancrocorticia sp.]|nr:glycoside hydrolase family 3 C-terminal domain-containing protein [Ancrocorticia sp.]MCI1933472.1 glycoside hydrolase family 3 C-terminal domain-containing protein [Ancrocorticia sp.]